MTVIGSVFGQDESYMPGDGKRISVSDWESHIVGGVGIGQRCELVITPITEGETPVAFVVASTSGNAYDSDVAGGTRLASTTPLEIYNPDTGAVIRIAKCWSGGDNFWAHLYPIDGYNLDCNAPPLVTSETTEESHAGPAASGISITKPTGTATDDLLITWLVYSDDDPALSLDDIGREPSDPTVDWTELNNEDGTPGVKGGASPSIRFFYHIVQAGETGPYRWGSAGSELTWGGTCYALRVSGQNDIGDCGLGMASLGWPHLFSGSGLTETVDYGDMDLQVAACDETDIMETIEKQPSLLLACFAKRDYSGSATGTLFTQIKTFDPLYTGSSAVAVDADGNAMMSTGCALSCRRELQPLGVEVGESTPFNWVGGWTILK